MKEITVQGYRVLVERSGGAYVVSVPELPGCAIQVDREEDAGRRIQGAIGDYLKELAQRRPAQGSGRKPSDEPTRKLRR